MSRVCRPIAGPLKTHSLCIRFPRSVFLEAAYGAVAQRSPPAVYPDRWAGHAPTFTPTSDNWATGSLSTVGSAVVGIRLETS